MYWLVSYERFIGDGYDEVSIRLGSSESKYIKLITKFNLFDLESRKLVRVKLDEFSELMRGHEIKNVWLRDGCRELFSLSNSSYHRLEMCNIQDILPMHTVFRNEYNGNIRSKDQCTMYMVEYTSEYIVALDHLGRVSVLSFDDALIQLEAGCEYIKCNLGIDDVRELSKGRNVYIENHKMIEYTENSGKYTERIKDSERDNSVREMIGSGGYYVGSNGVLTITGDPVTITCNNCDKIIVSDKSSFDFTKFVVIGGSCKSTPDGFLSYAKKLETLRLPQGIQRLGARNLSFTNMTKIDLRMYSRLRTLGWLSLSNNYLLTEVYFPDNVTKLGLCCRYNRELRTMLLPKKCISLQSDVFDTNVKLERIGLPEGKFSIPGLDKVHPDSIFNSLKEIYATNENYDMAKRMADMAGHKVSIIVGERA